MNKYLLNPRIMLVLVSICLTASISFGQSLSPRASTPKKLLEQQAASFVRLGRIEEALDIYLDLLYRDPQNSNLYFRVSGLLPGQENAQVLLEILEDLLKQQPGNTRLAAEKGRLFYILDRKEQANQYWSGLINKGKLDRYNYTAVSNAMLQAGATQEAIDLLQEGRLTLKSPKVFAFELARIHALKHNYSAASREYLTHLESSPGMLDHVANQLIKMVENDGAFEAIDAEFERFIRTPGSHQSIHLARAKLLLHEKEYEACVKTALSSDVSREMRHVSAIANDLAADEAWEQAAELYLYISSKSRNQKEVGEALLKLANTHEKRLQQPSNYQSYSGYFPGNSFLTPDIRLVQGTGSSLERTLKLYDSLQTILPKTPEAFQASYNIAEIHLTVSGDVDRALRGYKYIFDQSSNRKEKTTAGLRMVDAWLVRGDTLNAIRTLDEVAKRTHLDEDHPDYVTSRIKILLNRGDLVELKKELLNLSGAASPMDKIFNDGMELMALIEGNGAEDDPALRKYFEAEQMIYRHKLSEAIEHLLAIEGGAESIADEARIRAIQLMLLLGENEEAAQVMDDFLIEYGDSEWRPNVLVWRGEYDQFFLQQPHSAISFYEEVIVNYPTYLEVQKVRARLRELLGTGS